MPVDQEEVAGYEPLKKKKTTNIVCFTFPQSRIYSIQTVCGLTLRYGAVVSVANAAILTV